MAVELDKCRETLDKRVAGDVVMVPDELSGVDFADDEANLVAGLLRARTAGPEDIAQ